MAAAGVIPAVDEVHVARAVAADADREFAGQLRFRAGGEGGDLLVAHVRPLQVAVTSQRVGEAVQRVARHAIQTGGRRLP